MKKFPILSRETLVNSPFCHIEKQKVELPDGSTTDWFVNKVSDAVVILPRKKNREVLLQKNYKHGCGEVIWEFPAGMIDEAEDPQTAAERELLEETGFKGDLKQIGEVFSNPTGAQMKYHFFLAENCKKISEPRREPAEQIEIFWKKDLAEVRTFLQQPENKTSSATMALLSFL